MKSRAQPKPSEVKPSYNVQSVDIFGSMTLEKKEIKAKQQAKKVSAAAESASKTKGKQQVAPVDYHSRKDRGMTKAIYNDGVKNIPGMYNEEAQVEVKTHIHKDSYNFMNLNTNARTTAMHDQFEVIENIMKAQLKTEQFEDFFSPN